MLRAARYILAGVVVLAAVPSLATAGEAIKEVFIRNSSDNPVPVQGVGTQQVTGNVQVSNLPAARSLRQGAGYVLRSPRENVILPADLVLTDLVITKLAISTASTAPSCEVMLYERQGTEVSRIQSFYADDDDRTVQLHLETGITASSDEWGVTVTNDCVLRVLWSGYSAP